jgi:hypothetical protein
LEYDLLAGRLSSKKKAGEPLLIWGRDQMQVRFNAYLESLTKLAAARDSQQIQTGREKSSAEGRVQKDE